MNIAILSGELGQAAKIKDAGSSKVANSFLTFKNIKGVNEAIRIAAWGNQADELQKYQQGTMIVVEGRYNVLSIEREGGFKEKVLELNISKIHGVN